MATPIKIKRSAVAGKRPLVTDLGLGELALNTHDAELVTLRQRAFEHTFVSAAANAVNVQSGAESGNQKTPNGATYIPSTGVLTLDFGSAHGLSTSDTITLDNDSITFTCDADNHQTNHTYPRATDPIAGVTTAVTVTSTTQFTLNVGQGYSTEVVRTGAGATVTNVWYVTKDGNDSNTGKKLGDAKATIKNAVGMAGEGDVIHVSAGVYTEDNPIVLPKQLSIVGDSLREVTITPSNAGSDLFHVSPGNMLQELTFSGTVNSGVAAVAFDPNKIQYNPQSPYIRFCTNKLTNSIGMKVDGSKSIGPFKSMVTDSYTQYNANGIGVSLSNEGYAQIVSMFTMNLDVGIAAHSGGQCDVTNSNSSFGNYGMVSDGVGPVKYTGIITSAATADSDVFELDLNTPTVNISNFVYDHVSGLATVTTSGAHGFDVGIGVTLSNITVSCNYGSGTHKFVSAASNAVNVQSGAESGNQKTPNGATYVPSTGVLTLTFASAHGMSTSDTITLDNESITFTCAADDYATEHPYPRVSDPIAGITTAVTVGTTTSFTINVGSVPLQNKVYPDGNVGYIFDVKSVPSTTSFTTNIGVSKYAHTYVSGGTAKVDVIRPFDGQVIYFDTLYQQVNKVTVTNNGSGYTSPPTVTIDAPGTAWGVRATAVATLLNGKIDEIDIVSTGRGYTSTPTVTISGGGGSSGAASLVMGKSYYSIVKSTPISAGVSTITVDENVPYAVGLGVTVPFMKQSRIIASSHSFEYIGTGVDPLNSLPSRGAVPIQDNEVDDRNGGLTIFTSTDQAGQFRIGDGVIIDQQKGTISGNFYSKSLFSTMTPFILALGGD